MLPILVTTRLGRAIWNTVLISTATGFTISRFIIHPTASGSSARSAEHGSSLTAPGAAAARLAVPETAAASPAAEGGPNKAKMTRETAFKQLREIAEFFRKTDTHSFIAHHIDEAIRWGELSLPELLGELIGQDNLRKEVFTRIGIRTAEKNTPEKK